MKLLIGGSPCTHWSIAQRAGARETEAEGLGWELFRNYLIAREKYRPRYFLYENNKSMSATIKAQITRELGVEPILINSALVSAQNRQRYYWTNIPGVEQPEDRVILLRDVLESGTVGTGWSFGAEKARTLIATYYKGSTRDFEKDITTRGHLGRTGVIEPVLVGTTKNGKSFAVTAYYSTGQNPANTLKTSRASMVAESVCVAQRGRYMDKRTGSGQSRQNYEARIDGKTNAITTVQKDNMIAEPVMFQRPRGKNAGGMKYDKAPTLTGNGAWQQNNLSVEPVAAACRCRGRNGIARYECRNDGKANTLDTNTTNGTMAAEPLGHGAVPVEFDGNAPISAMSTADGKTYPVYEVKDGYISIKGELYKIRLIDGFYIIRKLTVTECMRLQTVPESYVFPVSNTQAYKMLGNGWTVDVVAHILSHAPKIATEPLEVLSMYDGMSCGHIALDKLGATVGRYYATENDKYAIKTTQHNYPGTVQLGDAFQVREDGWSL